MTKKGAHVWKIATPKSFLNSHSQKWIIFFSYQQTSNLTRSPMPYNTTASLEKLTCTDYVDVGKSQDKFGHFLGPKIFLIIGCKA